MEIDASISIFGILYQAGCQISTVKHTQQTCNVVKLLLGGWLPFVILTVEQNLGAYYSTRNGEEWV